MTQEGVEVQVDNDESILDIMADESMINTFYPPEAANSNVQVKEDGSEVVDD